MALGMTFQANGNESQCWEDNQCCYENSCGKFYFGADWLFWNANHSPIFVGKRFDSLSSAEANGKRDESFFNRHEGDGFRLRLGYDTGCSFAEVSYLHFTSDKHKSIERDDFDFLYAPGGLFTNLNSLKAKSELDYNNLDFCFGRTFCASECLEPFFYANARWVSIHFEKREKGVIDQEAPNTFKNHEKSEFNGGALGLGIGGRYNLGCNFGLNGKAGTMAVIGTTKLEWSTRDDTKTHPHSSIKDQKWNHVVPGFELALGLDYSKCFCNCYNLTVEFGYELQYYSEILRYGSSNLLSQGSSNLESWDAQDIGFSGPYFRLGLHF